MHERSEQTIKREREGRAVRFVSFRFGLVWFVWFFGGGHRQLLRASRRAARTRCTAPRHLLAGDALPVATGLSARIKNTERFQELIRLLGHLNSFVESAIAVFVRLSNI